MFCCLLCFISITHNLYYGTVLLLKYKLIYEKLKNLKKYNFILNIIKAREYFVSKVGKAGGALENHSYPAMFYNIAQA